MSVDLNLAQPKASSVDMRLIRERAIEVLSDRADAGSSLIEFALTLPPLLLIVTGIMVFGIATNNYIMLNNATAIAARQLAVSRGQITDPCSVASGAVIAASPTMNSANFTFSYLLNATPYGGTSCSSTSTSTGPAGNLVQGQPITVTVSYPCSLRTYNVNFAPTCNLQSSVTELVQ